MNRRDFLRGSVAVIAAVAVPLPKLALPPVYRYTTRVALPAAQWRLLNQGVPWPNVLAAIPNPILDHVTMTQTLPALEDIQWPTVQPFSKSIPPTSPDTEPT